MATKVHICKKLLECPPRLKEVLTGIRASDSWGRCGFDNFTEIVCCHPDLTMKIGRRPAETACHQFIWYLYKMTPRPHVAHGTPAKPGEFPFMVALGYNTTKPGQDAPRIKYDCGGSLISPQHVLTAAHCVNNIHELVPFEVRCGNVDISRNEGVQSIPISNIIPHPQYSSRTNYNDVAILKLKYKVHLSNRVWPICLETKSVTTIDITPNTRMVVIGWGATSFHAGGGSDTLMKTPSLRDGRIRLRSAWPEGGDYNPGLQDGRKTSGDNAFHIINGCTRNTVIFFPAHFEEYIRANVAQPSTTGRSELTCANLPTSLSLRSDSSRHFGLHGISLVLGSTLRGLLYRHRVPCPSSRRRSFSPEMRANLLLTILCHLIIGSMEFAIGNYNKQEEGDQCTLENGNQGICKKLPECPSRLKEVLAGTRGSDSGGRCGFDNFTEIVCCPVNVTEKIVRRSAETACQQYDNAISINGMAQNDLAFHILGGVDAQVGEFPYMVALGYMKKKTGADASSLEFSCGGSLITDKHVLTAAHCVNNIHDRVPEVVHLGNVNINSKEGTQRIPISNKTCHPDFRRNLDYNDVAILTLQSSVQISPTVKPICLQTKSLDTFDITQRTSLVTIGWGAFDDAFELSDTLKKTPSLRTVNIEVCKKSYSDYPRKLPHGIDNTLICAADPNTKRMADACIGDSGGPLLLKTESGVSVIGIAAFASACSTINPGVYTAIYPYLDWIEEHVWPTTGRNEKDTFPTRMLTKITV